MVEVNKEELYGYIKSMIGVDVNDTTCFFDSVGLSGLDAEQMMLQISERYNVDISDYDPAKYHLDEIEITNIFLHIWRAICRTTPKHSSFTALHLYNVVRAGKWFSPPPNEEPPKENEVLSNKITV